MGCQSGLRSLDPVPRFGVPKEGAAGGFVQFARTLLTADTTHPMRDDDDNGFGATVSRHAPGHTGVIKSVIVFKNLVKKPGKIFEKKTPQHLQITPKNKQKPDRNPKEFPHTRP